jgi:hypothetical protein
VRPHGIDDLPVLEPAEDVGPAVADPEIRLLTTRRALGVDLRDEDVVGLSVELRPEFRQSLRERAHRVTRGAEEIIEQGIAAGRFRPVNVRVLAPGLLATLNSLPDWVRPTRHGTLEDVTEQLLEVYLRGISVGSATSD